MTNHNAATSPTARDGHPLGADRPADSIPGGCGTCDAHQTVRQAGPRVHVVTVHHDDWCPTYRRTRGGR